MKKPAALVLLALVGLGLFDTPFVKVLGPLGDGETVAAGQLPDR